MVLNSLSTTAFLNHAWVDARTLTVSAFDIGFVQGVTVVEQLRTFGHKLFRFDQHMDRFEHSLEIVGIETGLDRIQWRAIAEQLVQRNAAKIAANDDWAIGLWATPGTISQLPPRSIQPTICGYARPIDFAGFHQLYRSGEHLVIAETRQTSPLNWPAELKCRSRMHYYLADQQACQKVPRARALMLDLEGFVCEATTANILIQFANEGLVTPRSNKALPGISLAMIRDLASELKVPLVQRDILPEELLSADEIMLCSTSPCIWPVTHLNSQPVGLGKQRGKPGELFQQLIAAWSQSVGIDIIAQAAQFSERRPDEPTPGVL